MRLEKRTVVLGLALVVVVGLLIGGYAVLHTPTPTPAPTVSVTDQPTATEVLPTASPAPASPAPAVGIVVHCNVPARLRLVEHFTGEEIAQGDCDAKKPRSWAEVQRTTYDLIAHNDALGLDLQQQVAVYGQEEITFTFPGLLEVAPVPADAEVEVDGKFYQGLAQVTFPAEQCPLTATFWVRAVGYTPYGTMVTIEAGQAHRQEVQLEALPTPIPVPDATPRPAQSPALPVPTTAPLSTDERVELVRQRLLEKVNCWRAEAGLGPLPYVSEWQSLADDYARGWLAYFQANGPNGFDDSAWRSQFQAAGGDAVTDNAALVLYAPDSYLNTAPGAQWDTFTMCDPTCPRYRMFMARQEDLARASGVVIGIVPWQDGDLLKAAIVIGVRW